MAQDAALHIKLDKETDACLKRLAQERGTSKGQLVRDDIATCYQTDVERLPLAQQQALAAYRGGYISLSRLAKAMGQHALELRSWLQERRIEPRTAYSDSDASHA